MQGVPLKIIADADERIPNAVKNEKKLSWINQLEARICAEVKRGYDRYVFTVEEEKPYLLPCTYEQVERIYRDGKRVPKIDLRSADSLKKGTYCIVYRSAHKPFVDTVFYDEEAVFDASGITFSRVHPFLVGDLIGISETGKNDWTATVTEVLDTAIKTDYDGFLTGKMAVMVSRIDDRETEIPENHPCFGIYEEYLCAQLAKHLGDRERYRLAWEEFERLWQQYLTWYKQTAPEDVTLRIRGL